MKTSRRQFLRIAGVAAATAILPSAASAKPSGPKAPATSSKRSLGNTGLSVFPIGFGAMTTRDPEVIRFGIEHGIDYVDTADCYMGGENERIVGRAIREFRNRIVLATKVHIDLPERMIQSCEKSLKSLNVDSVDILQLHGISSEAEVKDERAREALTKLIRQGKVRFPGVTTHSGQEEVLQAVVKHGFYRTVAVAYHFRSSDSLTSAVAEAGKNGIGIVGMKTQAGGYPSPPGGTSPHQAALSWVLGKPGVATTIPGMTSYAQVEENLGANGKRFSLRFRKDLVRYEDRIAGLHCTLCGTCRGTCPNGVDSQNVLRSLTYLEGYGEKALAKESYRSIRKDRNASACLSCAGCKISCRVGLNVRTLSGRAHALLG